MRRGSAVTPRPPFPLVLGLALGLSLGCEPRPGPPSATPTKSAAAPARAPPEVGTPGSPPSDSRLAFVSGRCAVRLKVGDCVPPPRGVDGRASGAEPVDASARPPRVCNESTEQPDPSSAAQLIIEFEDTMSSVYGLRGVALALDERVVQSMNAKMDADDLPLTPLPPKSFVLVAGEHEITGFVAHRNRPFGVYGYVRNYCFKVVSTRRITLRPGQHMTLKVQAFERGGVTTPLEERPSMRFLEAEPERPHGR